MWLCTVSATNTTRKKADPPQNMLRVADLVRRSAIASPLLRFRTRGITRPARRSEPPTAGPATPSAGQGSAGHAVRLGRADDGEHQAIRCGATPASETTACALPA